MGEAAAQALYSALAGVFGAITTGVTRLIFALIETILVPILQYNNFAGSRVIDLGWSLVRDVMNMMVIIILLALAIMTMLNVGKANWRQQIPALFIAVAAMNFSRLLCGLFIDLSQVVMFTFVNAILDIGAGNFAQLLGITGSGALNFSEGAGQAALTGAAALGSIVLQLGLMLAILAIMICLALAFLWRIVILWVLVILSPIAFFFRFAPNVIDMGFGKGGDWWGKFNGALVMGPMLSFFLWLALALSSSGNLLSAEGFPEPQTSSAFGNILESLSSSSLGATMLALMFLVVGMDMAGKSASAVGDFAADMINGKRGRKIVGQSVRYGAMANAAVPAAVGYAAYKGAWAVGGAAAGVAGAKGFANQTDQLELAGEKWTDFAKRKAGDAFSGARRGTVVSKNVADSARQSARDAYAGAGGFVAGVGTALGSDALVRLGDKARQQASADSEERQKEGKKQFGALTSDGKVDLLANIAQDPNLPQNEAEQNIRIAAQAELLKNRTLQTKRLEALKKEALTRFDDTEEGKKAAEEDAKKKLDGELTAALRRMGELESKNDLDPFMSSDDLRNSRNKYIDLYATIDKKKATALVDSDKFSVRDMRDEAIDSTDVVGMLRDATQRTTKEGRVTRWEEVVKGGAGQGKRDKAALVGLTAVTTAMETDPNLTGRATNRLDTAVQTPTDPAGDRKPLTREEINLNINAKNIREETISVRDLEGKNADAFTEALVDRRVKVQNIGSGLPASERDTARDSYVGRLEYLASGKDGFGRDLRANPQTGNVERDFSKEERERIYKAQQITDEEALRKVATENGSTPTSRATGYSQVINRRLAPTGQLDIERLRRLISSDIKNIRFINPAVLESNYGSEVKTAAQREVVRAVSPAALNEAVKNLQTAVKEKKTEAVVANRDFLRTVISSVRAEAERVVPNSSGRRDEEYYAQLAKKNARLAEVLRRADTVDRVEKKTETEYNGSISSGGLRYGEL